MKNNNSIVKSATYLGFGTFIAKLLGALYRVPLTAILGGVGLGLYQMVFPVYALLLDFSGASLPSALSKLISSNEEQGKYKNAHALLNVSARFFALFGFVLSALLIIFARPLARLQGNEDAFYAYIFLAPAILFVSLISVLRGYFQGLMNMKPTALSQILEQTVKLVLGVLFAYLFGITMGMGLVGIWIAFAADEMFRTVAYLARWKKGIWKEKEI
jgi:stage V sporulation protein B